LGLENRMLGRKP